MKNTLLSLMIAATVAAFAQDTPKDANKPEKGSIGIWYAVNLVPVSQNVLITGYATKNVEVGGSIGIGFSRNSNSTYTSTSVFTPSFNTISAQMEHRTVNSSVNFSIAPMFLYHFNINSNVDLGLGANVPINISTTNKNVVSDITTADSYNHTEATTTKGPLSVGGGIGMLISCKYFFYRNLAIGAMANLGFNANMANGHNVVESVITNSGSNNPDTSGSTNTTSDQVGANNQSFSMLHNFNLNLSWYFGSKKKNKATN